MADTARRMLELHHLPNFAYAVDGTFAVFFDKPRRLPPGPVAQQYWCRKQKYAINCQIVSNDKFVYDVDVGWCGTTHDSRIWERSEVKMWIEDPQRRPYKIAGDRAYRITPVLMKPYTTAETEGNVARTEFNAALSGLRTRMSENVYGRWKRRWPYVKAMRADFEKSQKIIVSTLCLHNLATRWGEPDFDGSDESGDEEEEDNDFRDADGEVQRLAGRRVREDFAQRRYDMLHKNPLKI